MSGFYDQLRAALGPGVVIVQSGLIEGGFPYLSPSHDEMAMACGLLCEETLLKLAYGEWPEPHCGVCRALPSGPEWGTPSLPGPAWIVSDYHDAPRRERRDLPKSERGRLDYLRCLEIYEAARTALAVRTYGPAGASEGMGI